jgi:hypothetical protein
MNAVSNDIPETEIEIIECEIKNINYKNNPDYFFLFDYNFYENNSDEEIKSEKCEFEDHQSHIYNESDRGDSDDLKIISSSRSIKMEDSLEKKSKKKNKLKNKKIKYIFFSKLVLFLMVSNAK